MNSCGTEVKDLIMLGDDLSQACRVSIVIDFACKATSLFLVMLVSMHMLSRHRQGCYCLL